MTEPSFIPANAPLRIGGLRLRVRDMDRVAQFYQRVIGLSVLNRDGESVTLGTATLPLLELWSDRAARLRDPRDAGLFHTAFLLPDRADLARWLAHAIGLGVRLQGASDHIVSEAIYLEDPEGNGIEVYADRPPRGWRNAKGQIHMVSDPLDLSGLLAAGAGPWAGFPSGGILGHVHLQVGDTTAAEGFYRDILGFELASRYPGASFFGSGGYHHHLAGNMWNSRGAGPRAEGVAGLDLVTLVVPDPALRRTIRSRAETAGVAVLDEDAALVLADPWGTAIALRAG